jgi:putative SOS response-associated peptidase YedK
MDCLDFVRRLQRTGAGRLLLVPATRFWEYTAQPNPATGKNDVAWHALDRDLPQLDHACIWTPWTGTRGTKAKPVEGNHLLFRVSD